MIDTSMPYGMEKIQFAMLSMEGPDLYSLAGGLGQRAKELCGYLASTGCPTHLYFVGDPNLPAEEDNCCLHIHRWCQWISAQHPGGLYLGENEKIQDLANYWPESIVKDVIAPAAKKGVTTIILAEEWQTVPAVINLGKLLEKTGLNKHALILWNANNLYGFEGINWEELKRYSAITTVSKYMKHRMWLWGINPIVIHNGIPERILKKIPSTLKNELREIFPNMLLSKIGRYDVDKRWVMAMETLGEMKRRGQKVTMIARGGTEYHRVAVREAAMAQGLTWHEIKLKAKAPTEEILKELELHKNADVLELCFFVSEDFINLLYYASDCVLANSGHEPFGLVGLEVMAVGGLPFVGSTGEDYATTLLNSAVIETDDPIEMVEYINTVVSDEDLAANIRKQARITAEHFTWKRIVRDIYQKARFLAASKGIVMPPMVKQSGAESFLAS